ncbi:MAG: hypothetical protein CML20_02430 [Rheinheimera sp.]|uniref:hypothetical protein n=1 Tax=Arsukibacterium sp. UBA3155 TaxID=1946058 RepID=UPI000C9878DE|nr:hypothetical protein [Arsukibacterium sp. UBA3155]MAD73656.1 hypothetical protein [Rheinheimera sp.]|tara:strand:- start:221423 stop:222700 length:1278 start_codon:yes stop_codon:yes gene_type:complete
MLRLVIAILVVLLIYFSYQLFRDDPLLPEAQAWLKLTEQQPDLENNAIIYLLGLNLTGADYANALQRYQQAMQDKTYQSSPLHYPGLPDLKTLELETLNCQLAMPECQQLLLVKRQETELVIQQYQAIIAAFYQLVNFDNFANLDTFITEPQFDELTKLYRLAANEIYYLITDNKLDKAAAKLTALLTIERSLMRNSGEMTLHVLPIIHTESLYQPLFIKLQHASFTEWAVFDTALAPLSNTERLMNKVWQYEFANQANSINSILPATEQSTIVFKPNMTINMLTQFYQTLTLNPDILPTEFQAQIAHSEKLNTAFRQKAKVASQPWRIAIYNYRNVVGSLMVYTTVPRFLDLLKPKLELDLRLHLLHAMVHEVSAAELNTERYRNPYTGQPPYLNEGQLCHKLEQEICVPWPHGQQPTLTPTEL